MWGTKLSLVEENDCKILQISSVDYELMEYSQLFEYWLMTVS